MLTTKQLLPPRLIHELRVRSYRRLFRMTGDPGNRGFGRSLRQRINTLVTRQGTLVEKAITIAYLGSYLVDHIIFAEKEACRILDKKELSEDDEHKLWECTYSEVIDQLSRELPEGNRILDELSRVENYTKLSSSVDQFRQRHWKSIDHIFHGGFVKKAVAPTEISLLRRIQKLLSGRSSKNHKARATCLYASMLADMECWSQHLPWPVAYSQIMTDLYSVITQFPDVLEQIIRLS